MSWYCFGSAHPALDASHVAGSTRRDTGALHLVAIKGVPVVVREEQIFAAFGQVRDVAHLLRLSEDLKTVEVMCWGNAPKMATVRPLHPDDVDDVRKSVESQTDAPKAATTNVCHEGNTSTPEPKP